MTVNIADHGFMLIWDGVYYFPLSGYPRVTPWELKKLLAFIDYERQHGRETEVVCEDAGVLAAADRAFADPETVADAALPGKLTECAYCEHRGCLTEYVCHTAEPENAKKIFACGMLLSAARASGRSARELASEKRNAAGDPEDYFDYVMFNWGNCTGGYRLVMERLLGRIPDEDDLEQRFMPGVRYFFRYADVAAHPGFAFDGYHPAKIKDGLALAEHLHSCVIPKCYEDEFKNFIRPEIAGRVFYLPQDGLGMRGWTKKAYDLIIAPNK